MNLSKQAIIFLNFAILIILVMLVLDVYVTINLIINPIDTPTWSLIIFIILLNFTVLIIIGLIIKLILRIFQPQNGYALLA